MSLGAFRNRRVLVRAGIFTALGAVPVLVLSAPAYAATGTAKVGNTIQVNAANNRANNITITRAGANFFITDLGDTPAAGAGCAVAGVRTVRCSAAGVVRLVVNTGNLNDRVNNLTGTPSTQNGGLGNDTLLGGTGPDLLIGAGGNDGMTGRAGLDTLLGQAGNDTANALAVADGRDVFSGGVGNDTTSYANRGARVVVTLNGAANDGAPGELDNNLADVENINGGRGNDLLVGNAVANRINGNLGNDTLNGLAGNDTLTGGFGNDTSIGGLGNDTAVALALRDGRDTFSGGPGVDTTNYAARALPVNVTLNNIANDGSAPEFDNNLVDVENVIGGRGSDNLVGSAAANRMFGLGGADFIFGGAGNDTLVGGAGGDRMFGQAGNDTLNSVDGVRGNDRNDGGVNVDRCVADLLDVKISCEL
ncbi:Hemolysin-type calcium-binding repeat-containing protein [Paractinoplanes atraurantiacus]|uniref:Hemolysin-type calcium-binding repeat-containing protein n=1 Tax=Paractinoplanes atraurantiacus TaxID=1036182 RepID=A0A285J022_9ACTN|nr:Hemolysin-type calcium-binding repeat-containing protein [Actinoplanes atraurantiacus]